MRTVRRVLVVDDEPLILRAYARALSRAGFAVTTADDGLEATALFLAGGFDVVVTDLLMPRLSGVDLAQRVRAHDPAVPVIVVTATLDSTQVARARAMGVAAVLAKPLADRDLVEAVGVQLALAEPPAGERLLA